MQSRQGGVSVKTNNNQIYDKVIKLIDETKEYYSEKTFPKPEKICLSPDRCSAENCRKVLDNLREDVEELKKHKCPECGYDITRQVQEFLERQPQLKDGQVFSGKSQAWGYGDGENFEIEFDDRGPRCGNCDCAVSVYVKMMAEVR
jgi:hypothetical protein